MLLALGLLVALSSTTWAAEPATLALSATGTVSASPDEGYITAGVTTVAPTSAEAVKQNSEAMVGIFKAVKDHGIDQKHFQTVQFDVSQNYKEVPHPTLPNRTQNVPDGFRVSNMIRITVCDLGNFGKVLDALAANGANKIQSISFGSSEAAAHLVKARAEACKEVKMKAHELCEGLGVEVRNIRSISEQRQYSGGMRYDRMAMQAESAVPVSGGSLTFSVTVNVVWEISDSPRVRRHPHPIKSKDD